MYLDDVSTIVLPFTEEIPPMKKKICAVTQPKFGRMQTVFLIEGFTDTRRLLQCFKFEGTSKSQLNAAKTKLKN
jgi:RNA polymerase sigma-70 factor (ECF subfamily)